MLIGLAQVVTLESLDSVLDGDHFTLIAELSEIALPPKYKIGLFVLLAQLSP